MHACADRIVDLFKCRQRGNTMVPDDVLSHNPAKLCYVMKQALREGAIGESIDNRLWGICQFYNKAKTQISIISYHRKWHGTVKAYAFQNKSFPFVYMLFVKKQSCLTPFEKWSIKFTRLCDFGTIGNPVELKEYIFLKKKNEKLYIYKNMEL